ncbi:MAG: radical SAM family heme chaperone HemW [Nitrospirae bacterium]|nr:radical SAM family heme chaperone HemW [Nitrospirota bacterium]
MTDREFGVYVHIPYCKSRCPYCHFNTYLRPDLPEARYSEAILREAAHRLAGGTSEGRGLASIYFGGGTPSLFSQRAIERMIRGLWDLNATVSEPEITIEMYPEAESIAKLDDLQAAGVNRFSFGMQSMYENDRKRLWRTRSLDPWTLAEGAKRAGVRNLSMDFIYGRPGQTPHAWTEELKEIVGLGLPHLSLYLLTPEDDTPLISLLASGRLALPEDGESAEMAQRAWDVLTSNGYRQYEISNFARPGFECRHNLLYWTPGREYLGLGAGAHSLWGGRRCENTALPEEYLNQVERNGLSIAQGRVIDREDKMQEFFYLGLRRDFGVSIREFHERFETDPRHAFPGLFQRGESNGWLAQRDDSLTLTPHGRLFSDALFRELF